jgi:hypothetical protein
VWGVRRATLLREREVGMEVRFCCASGIYTRNPLLGLDRLSGPLLN